MCVLSVRNGIAVIERKTDKICLEEYYIDLMDVNRVAWDGEHSEAHKPQEAAV